jgi:choline dehydrogenase-like flavoprotein
MTLTRYRDSHKVDFAIVGSGAAGGVMARELARNGFQVVLFEQGPRLGPAQFQHDELSHWFLAGITNDPRVSPQSFRASASEPTVVSRFGRNPLFYARMVGGSSAHFTGNYWRLREIDFDERSRLGEISGTGFTDWPIRYAQLEPYYTKVDWEVGVSGLAGAHPGEPPRSKPYPMPPLPVKSSGVLLERGARKLGLHPFPAPMAINSVPYRGRPGCGHCGFCHGFPCEFTAKSSTLFTMIPEAEATGRCEVRSDSYVSRIETNASGRATGVTFIDGHKRTRFQHASAVVVCANGAETPRLLLMSESSRFPQGLGNSSGVVGKYLMFNYSTRMSAVFEHELNEHKSVQVTRILHDFYESDPKRGFYGGGGIDARIGPQPAVWALRAAEEGPSWGSGYKARLMEFSRSMVIAGHGTSLPVATNNVSLDPELKDAWGMPAIRTTYRDHPDDLANARFLQDRSVEIAEAAGAVKIMRGPIAEQNFALHLLGTCRMGNDPDTSVIDRYHRTHDVRNLFLCDGSSFVTSGRGQPTMTIQALAFRAADHIGRFARRGEI